MSVKLELYRVFKEVAEAGNITAAAQALYISQSACWRPARRSCPRAGSCRWDT